VNILFRHLRLLFSVVFVLCIIVSSAKADSACTAGNLSTLMNTTCDIGSLQFTFNSFSSFNFSDNGDGTGSTTFYWDPLTPNNFTFTPLSNGFRISINTGPQPITSTTDTGLGTAETVKTADLYFGVTDLDGDFVGMSVAGTLDTSGPYTMSEIRGVVGSGPNLFGEGIYGGAGGTETDSPIDIGSPFASGGGDATIIDMYGQDGGSAYWGGTSIFTFATEPAPASTPEPSSFSLVASGLAILLGATLYRRRRGSSGAAVQSR
jgi:hypothetical protein